MSAKEYFDDLESYLNLKYYKLGKKSDRVIFKEKIYTSDSSKIKKTTLKYSGKLLAIKLDKKPNKARHRPLFHFLNDNDKPWSKRCDFILFNYQNRKISVFLFECKSHGIATADISRQLKSSENWCRSLVQTIKSYTQKTITLHLTKYVLTNNPNPSNYLDQNNKYLAGDGTVRHYSYTDIDGMHLDNLDNDQVKKIK